MNIRHGCVILLIGNVTIDKNFNDHIFSLIAYFIHCVGLHNNLQCIDARLYYVNLIQYMNLTIIT